MSVHDAAGQNPITCHWIDWCRLCAKDSKHNISYENYTNSSKELKLSLREPLEKYFGVQTSSQDSLPKKLCANCFSLVAAMINFNERVERVQLMISFLADTQNFSNFFDLNSVRLKFKVIDAERDYCLNSFFLIGDDDKNLNFNICKKFSIDDPVETQTKEVNIESTSDTTSVHKEEIVLIDNLNSFLSKDEETFEQEQGEQISPKNENLLKPLQSKNETFIENTQLDKSKKKSIEINADHIAFETCIRNKTLIEDIKINCSCKACDKEFSNYILYRAHMQQKHKHSTSEICWPCPFCDDILLSLYDLEHHVRFHKVIEARKDIKCPECDKYYKTKTQLRSHIRHKHKNQKLFICEKCGLRTTSSHLRQHLLIHNDVAPFECGVCKKKFKDRARLKSHMDIHSSKKHECDICGLLLNSKSTFNHHRLVHSDERRHKCDYCGKAFKRSNNFKNHLLLHTGLMLFSCDFCEKSFANRNICRSHMRKKHPEELAKLDATGNKTYTTNIPKIEALKAITKEGENLRPVLSDVFGCRRKPKAIYNSEANKISHITK